MTTDLIYLIQTLGFPIFVCLYFMFRMEKQISNNTAALNKISGIISNLGSRNKPN